MAQADNQMPIGDVLRVAAGELADLALLGDQVEAIIAEMVGQAGDVSPDLLRRCQAADLLTQRLAGAAAFLGALAEAAPSNASIDVLDAVRGITLTDQAQRLSGQGVVAHQGGAGELALFED